MGVSRCAVCGVVRSRIEAPYLPAMEQGCVFIVGYMGAGKSTSGRRLAQLMGLDFLDTDTALRSTFGVSIPTMFDQMGEVEFRKAEQRVLMDLVEGHSGALISTGGGAACHPGSMDFMRANGTVVYFQMGAAQLAQRLQGKSDERPLLVGISEEALPGFIAGHLAQREPHYRKANITVDAAHLDDARLRSVRDLILAEWDVSP